MRRPSLSSFWRTSASTVSPTSTTSLGVDVVLDGKLARGGDDTLGLVADVEENLVAVDLHDGALDEVAVVEELQRLLDRGEEIVSRPDVVDRDLLGRLGRYGGHVVDAPNGQNQAHRRKVERMFGSAMGMRTWMSQE